MTLNQLRSRIDQIDLKLLKALNRRAALTLRVGKLKKQRGLAVFDKQREGALLRRLNHAHAGPLSRLAVQGIFRKILQESRKLQSSVISRKMKRR